MTHSDNSDNQPLTDGGRPETGGIEPRLLRELTTLYVQKQAHTDDDERQYSELALRLLDLVDIATRISIARQLAPYPKAPADVMRRLARDVPEVAAPVLRQTVALALDELVAIAEELGPIHAGAVAARDEFRSMVELPDDIFEPLPASEATDVTSSDVKKAEVVEDEADSAMPLSEIFFAADAAERRLILLNLDYAQIAPAKTLHPSIRKTLAHRLELAALTLNTREFIQIIQNNFGLSAQRARQIVEDRGGEAVAAAMKSLAMPSEIFQRVILFLNPVVGLSVPRVHDLATLYNEISESAARRLLAIWQADGKDEARPAPHTSVLAQDDAPPARSGPDNSAQRQSVRSSEKPASRLAN